MNIWFTADTHFGHSNIIKYCNRPFKTVEEMDETLMHNWNSVVKENDIVYHLGDFKFYRSVEYYMNRLKGKVFLILGNHDSRLKNKERSFFAGVAETAMIKCLDLYLTHVPCLIWDKKVCINVHGHSHGTHKESKRQIDVGVDA